MKHFRFPIAFTIALLLYSWGCDTGLAPLNEPAGFSGTLHFKNWPQNPDSVKELRIVAFESYPTDSLGIIQTFFRALAGGSGVAIFPSVAVGLPKYVDTASYAFTTKDGVNLQVQKYDYIIVAALTGSNALLSSAWRPAGVYTTDPNSFNPAPVRVLLHRITPNIDFEVDFHKSPPRPW